VVAADQLEDRLGELLRTHDVHVVVVGVPKTLGGEVGFQAAKVLYTLRNLKERFPEVSFVEWDERLTTRAARAGGSEGRTGRRRGGGKKARPRERVDHLAAAVMLQEYLDRRGSFETIR
jgi:putative Holliday junction resolvase